MWRLKINCEMDGGMDTVRHTRSYSRATQWRLICCILNNSKAQPLSCWQLSDPSLFILALLADSLCAHTHVHTHTVTHTFKSCHLSFSFSSEIRNWAAGSGPKLQMCFCSGDVSDFDVNIKTAGHCLHICPLYYFTKDWNAHIGMFLGQLIKCINTERLIISQKWNLTN